MFIGLTVPGMDTARFAASARSGNVTAAPSENTRPPFQFASVAFHTLLAAPFQTSSSDGMSTYSAPPLTERTALPGKPEPATKLPMPSFAPNVRSATCDPGTSATLPARFTVTFPSSVAVPGMVSVL